MVWAVSIVFHSFRIVFHNSCGKLCFFNVLKNVKLNCVVNDTMILLYEVS